MFTKPKWWLSIEHTLYLLNTSIATLGVAVLVFLLPAIAHPQRHDANWVMGNSPVSNITFNANGTVMQDTLPVQKFYHRTFVQGGASISDSAGNLQFFTNGYYVFDKNGEVMQNGSGLNPTWFTVTEWKGLNPIIQCVLILPQPGNPSVYYIFHHTLDDTCGNYIRDRYCTLYYSTVDMKANSGLGSVVVKNKVLMQGNELAAGQLAACRHANGRDWWVIKNGYVDPIYHKFMLTDSGISYQGSQTIGSGFWHLRFGGTSVFSQDGTKFASGREYSWVSLMDFNRCTGEFSNPDSIFAYSSAHSAPSSMFDSATFAFSVAFSPSGRYLYANAASEVYQYDLQATNIQGSEVLLAASDSIYAVMQLAPNGKLYISRYQVFNSNQIAVIHHPDSAGVKCQFQSDGITLPKYAGGMPNFPNFRLGASPIYQMGDAGPNRTICRDSTTQLGSAQKVNELLYTWRSTDPNAYISDVHHHHPTVSTTADEALFIVDVVDTVSRLTCLERSDTVVVKTYTCYPNQLNIPTIIKSGSHPYLVIPNLPANTAIAVYNAAGQLMYESANYQNQW
ncbi:MAG: hypothetical protein JNK66_12600, partial [Chitinophagales bacterium]|nr:hypothetical protein [Chitinophagales bacterium]